MAPSNFKKNLDINHFHGNILQMKENTFYQILSGF